jgi:phage recombination protein Bet
MSSALVTFTPQQVALLKRTVAKDANPLEFDLFVEVCRARGLNPLVRHAYCLVMSKDKPDKRQMVIVVSIDGQRHIAEKTGNYRGDDRAPRFEVDPGLKGPLNPAGLISAEVSVYKHSHGEWFPVTAVAYWDEAVPLSPIWEDKKPTDKMQIAPGKDGWKKMPRLMLAKVAEMMALRKAFPDTFSGLYGEAEMDRGEVLDLTPSEWAEKADQEDRLAKIGGPNLLVIDWIDGNALAPVPADRFLGQAMDFVRANREEPSTIAVWQDRNRASLQQFWGVKPAEALELKKEIEKATIEGAAA